MKKQILLGLMMIFFISSSLFAGFSDSKGNEKSAVKSTKENKLSDEEMSRLTRRAETGNLPTGNFTNKSGTSKNNLMPAKKQVVVEGRHRHGYLIYGGGTVVLIIILVLLLA